MVKFIHKTNSDKIIVKGAHLQKESPKTAASIFPGYLVEITSDGKVQAQSVAGADCRRAVATENSLIGHTKNTEYGEDMDNVFTSLCPTGIEAQLRVAAGYSTAIAVGDALMAAGDGTVVKHTVADPVNTIIAFALEAVDQTGTDAEAFILSEIK